MTKDIPYLQLRTFCHVASEKSVKKAASKLFVTAGAISQQMKQLEAHVGKKLFEGGSRRTVQLTPDGQNLFKLAAPVIDKLDVIGLEFERMSGTVAGEIKIASFTSMLLYVFPEYLAGFEQLYPQCEVRLFNVSGYEIRSMVLSGQVDFGIGSVSSLPDDMIGKELWSFERFFIAPKNHPLSKRKGITYKLMADYPIVMADYWGTGGSELENRLRSYNSNLKIAMYTISWEVVLKYVELGYGVSVAPGIVFQPKDRYRLYISSITRSDKTAGISRYGILLKKGKYLSPAARELINFLAPGWNPQNA